MTIRWLLIGVGGFGFIMLFGVVLDIMLLLNGFRRAVMSSLSGATDLPPFRPRPTCRLPTMWNSVSEKLQQLEEVRMSGSISDEEYKRMREAILKKR